MAPVRPREPSIDRTDAYDDFLRKLEAYHEKRGTTLDPEPKIGTRHLDLLKLYTRVIGEGGYDAVSDTKGNKLAWRKLAGEFLPGSNSLTTQAFLVKSAYYKNLAAYEISTFHNREPPPKEILEDVSAKGGDLLNRTVENYLRPTMSREAGKLANGHDSSGSDEEGQETPKREDKMDVDEPTSTGGRVTRALRHAPPQRVLFQPEVTSSRQTRMSTNTANSPTPGSNTHAMANGAQMSNGVPMTIANYEPKPLIPSAVKPVVTPGNNPEHYRQLRNKLIVARKLARGMHQHRGMMLPGTGFVGPNIYIRALMALQSGIFSEVQYSLHHLVKISHERGDKYRFDGFPGLAEALIGKVLEISSLFYDMKWQISYSDDEDANTGSDMLNGLAPTRDLLQKIHSHMSLDTDDALQTTEFIQAMGVINEAALILRNMVMLEENALYISRIPMLRDFITVALNLPRRGTVVEIRHYALEIAEQITKYFILDAEDPLYQSLLAQLKSDDRGTVITTLRALSLISSKLEAKNGLEDIPIPVLRRICDWLLVEDEELRDACLVFLNFFTAITDNVEVLLHNVNMDVLIGQLSRLLMYHAVMDERRERPKTSSSLQKDAPVPEMPPKLSAEIVAQLCKISDEREASSNWPEMIDDIFRLRTCFEEDPSYEVTQIQLWSSYNECFTGSSAKLMNAKDFITNVSSTFAGATAMVRDGNPPKYTIKGIRPRSVPVDQKGRSYMPCQWRVPATTSSTNGAPLVNGNHQARHSATRACGEFANRPQDMYEHIVSTHLGIMKDVTTGAHKTDPETSRRYSCGWGTCRRFTDSAGGGESNPALVARHVQTHLPDDSALAATKTKHNRTPEDPSTFHHHAGWRLDQVAPRTWMNTQVDETGAAAGLPIASVAVLRNLARQMVKVPAGEVAKEGGWVRRLFDPVTEQLAYVAAHNLSLKAQVGDLIRAVAPVPEEDV